MEYFSILFFVILFSVLSIFKRRNAIYFFPIVLCLVVFSGTRYQTGNDWMGYQQVFDAQISSRAGIFDTSGRMEIGYLVVNNIVVSVGGELWWIFFIFALMNVFLFYKGFLIYTPFVSVALLLYLRFSYLQLDFMFLRQGLAIAIFFYALKYIVEKRAKLYFILILLACFFHISAVVLFPLYFLLNRHFSLKFLWTLALTSLILGMSPWMEYLFSIIEAPLKVIGLASPIKSYLFGDTWADQGRGFSISIVEKVFVLVFFSCYINYFNRRFNYFSIFFNLGFLALLTSLIFMNYYVFSERLVIIFNVAYIILISYTMSILSPYTRVFALMAIASYVSFWWIRYILTSDVYLPYNSIIYTGGL
ncbi:MAG: EpsG family protein [Thalassolituus maritimus]|uniref:EpsG family protein n=1 Tax=Thalassolituus maritimus TaxID=484498 RepID=A0A1N7N3N3_9GAMM|nr:EpsG family protein [Thalassolituus maritimus]TPD55169.1 MAG: EpsG family protein [Thalassolituus maritimus]SIS92977.1 EpsG family protein [Thalassolituus maritimus]